MISLFRYFVFILALSLFIMPAAAQSPVKNYQKEWKKIEDLAKKGLPKSALLEVQKLYILAKKEGQDAQVIKTLVYITNLQNENRENNEVLSIAEFEKEINSNKEPAASIIKSIVASMYWGYYQDNRWAFYNRSETVNYNKEDVATWSPEDFFKKISALFLASVKEKNLLQKTSLSRYDAIITEGNTRHIRPALFDLLAFRTLEYFQNVERDINKPAYAFEINQAAAFETASEFIRQKFTTKDSLSLEHKALLVYQELLAFHLRDAKPDALIDADLHRLAFVKQKSTNPDKDKLYFIAIEKIARQYENLPAASQAWYLVARYYKEKADTYKAYGDSTHRFAAIKARDICKQVLLQKDSSEGKINCFNLLNEINSLSLKFSVEKVNVPGLPFRSFVEYKNLNTLYLRIIRADNNIRELLSTPYDENYWSALISAQPVKKWTQFLSLPEDLQQHKAEIKIDGLPSGEYVLVASNKEDFSGNKTLMGARYFYVSGISYINEGNNFFLMDRDNGKPLAKAGIQVWEQRYDYSQSKYIKEKGKFYTPDANGYFRMEKKKMERYQNYTYLLEVTNGKDRLFMNDLVYDYYYSNIEPEKPEPVSSIFLFTDRSIYRPGQLVYFKGIVLYRNTDGKSRVEPGYKTTIIIRDANYKDIDSMVVTANEFGSFNGKFTLPSAGLNGLFTLYTRKGSANSTFRMEEYKRPKFYVDYEPVKGTYRVNDKIKVTGFAKAYAGNNIDGATVAYRVVREPRFPYPWVFWRWWQPPANKIEIIHGEVKTDLNGKFIIEFQAIPDLSIDKKFEPFFDYKIYADVTDINGETRIGEKIVSVSYKSLMLVTSLPSTLPADSLKKISIRTQNMNGEHERTIVIVNFTSLVPENRLIRDRYWERPDQFVINKDEYIRNFPNDEYDNETDFKSWKKGKVVYSGVDTSRVNGEWLLSPGRSMANVKIEPGFYEVEFSTKDKNGEEVKDIKYIELFDEKSKQIGRPEYLWSGVKNNKVEPGEIAKIELGTAADNVFLVQLNTKSKKLIYDQLSAEKRIFIFPVNENDRGGYGVSWMFIKHNRYHILNENIIVPWSNKELAIEYASFREKTLPGSEEKWKIRISGYKNEKIAAEMLASMYDASLDQFYDHNWNKPYVWPSIYNYTNWSGKENFTDVESIQKSIADNVAKYLIKNYDVLTGSETGYGFGYKYRRMDMVEDAEMGVEKKAVLAPKTTDKEETKNKDGDGVKDEKGKETDQKPAQPSGDIKIRKNFNETAFFFPELRTDSSGTIEFSFTLPESLTRWKFMAMAHTKDAAFGSSTKEIVTQKELMVQPNPPRFFREGDKMEFNSKIVNLTGKELTGTAELQLFDATTNEPVDGLFHNMVANQYFTVAAGQSEVVKFPIEIPYQFNKALVWRVIAKSGNYSDGEENAMPVLTNRMLVTETMPLPMRGSGSKNFSFDKLINSGNNQSLQHYSISVEYTSNPAWYAVQALSYLMEYPYDCAEQTWNRYYANSLATYISNSSPRIKLVFEQWKIKDSAALVSNLQKNQELKAVLLEETPWVLQAKNESEQKRNIGLLFDMIKMSEQLNNSFEKLKTMQSSNGGFVWFSGGPDDRYMTQYIVTGIGHLLKLNAIAGGQSEKLNSILNTAIPYLDRQIKKDYDDLIKYKTDLNKYVPGYTTIQYLYMRSFFTDRAIDKASQTAYNYFRGRTQKTWVSLSNYMQSMIALALYRTQDNQTPAAILKSLKERAIVNEELGMYYKDQRSGWFWHEAPIETQALLIEAFQEAGKDTKTVDDLRTWLLKNKQTNNWKTTKATAEACYALLIQGSSWITDEPVIEIKLGTTTINSVNTKSESGTGYFKEIIEGKKVNPGMGNISVTVSGSKNNGVSWGGVYWQYFEDLDKITSATTPLKLSKKLFIEKNTDRGPVLSPVNDGSILHVGDKVKVRIELRADRDMEYVHMKDMRAAAMEPVNVLSGYKWQGGLGYYETTKDASTNFFFNYLGKGTYVFEYTLFVTHAGNFSNGITSIQCMYAPEFSSHSEGIRINVE